MHPIFQVGIVLIIELGKSRDGSEIAVGASGVAHITQAEGDGEIGFEFPGVAEIEGNAIIRAAAACGKAKGWNFRGKTLTVSEGDAGDRKVQRICSAAGETRVVGSARVIGEGFSVGVVR